MKRCKVCGQLKVIDDFYRAKGTRDGHRSECIACNLAEKRARTALDPQSNRDRVKRWALANPEKVLARVAAMTGSEKKKLADRKSYLKRTYGMSLEDYQRMFDAHGGVCAICGKPRPEERTLHVDHDHETGEIRGLLCFSCNQSLGSFHEEYELFQRAADYLDRDDALAALARTRVKALTG